MMIKIRIRILDLLSVGWLALGIIVFLLGWCQWYVSLPLVFMIMYVSFQMYTSDDMGEMEISSGKFWGALAICAMILVLCGIGGYVVQPNDDVGRNAIFRDIMNYSWPVYDGRTANYMVYYLGFWMVPGAIGKLFGSMEIGFLMQVVWLSLGFHLLFLQICRYIGKARISYLWFLCFFSSMKILEFIFDAPVLGEGWIHQMILDVARNNSSGPFHAAPMIQLLYDPFNQTIPLFLGMAMMINNVRSRYIPFIYGLLFLYCPLPLIGLTPIVLYWFVKNIWAEKSNRLIGIARSLFSFENITALLLLILLGMYMMSNIAAGHRSFRPVSDWGATLYEFIVYLVLEFGVFTVLGWKSCQDKRLLVFTLLTVALFAWVMFGNHNDFCFRTNMPLIFMLMLLVTKRYYESFTTRRVKATILILLIVGGVPAHIHPMLRWISTAFIATGHDQAELNRYQRFVDVKSLYVMRQTKIRNDDLKSVFRPGPLGWMCVNFRGTPNSFFFTYLARKKSPQ